MTIGHELTHEDGITVNLLHSWNFSARKGGLENGLELFRVKQRRHVYAARR